MIRYLLAPSQVPRIVVWIVMLAALLRTFNLAFEMWRNHA